MIMRVHHIFLTFLLCINNNFLQAIDLTAPMVGFGSEVAAATVQHAPHLLQELGMILLKNGAAWVPTLVVGGAVVYGGVKGLAYLKCIFDSMLESISNTMKAPGRVKDIDENVVSVATQLTNHITDFSAWKDEIVDKITGIETNIIANIKNYVKQLFDQQRAAQKQENNELKTVVTDNIRAIDSTQTRKFAEVTHKIGTFGEGMQQQFEEQNKLLHTIQDALLDLTEHLRAVPNEIDQAKMVEQHMVDKLDKIEKNTEHLPKDKNAIAMNTSGHSLGGSGVFSQLVRPELNKISDRLATLEYQQKSPSFALPEHNNEQLIKMMQEIQHHVHLLSLVTKENEAMKQELMVYRALFSGLCSNMNMQQAHQQSSFISPKTWNKNNVTWETRMPLKNRNIALIAGGLNEDCF